MLSVIDRGVYGSKDDSVVGGLRRVGDIRH
jgi:hypothetical protein